MTDFSVTSKVYNDGPIAYEPKVKNTPFESRQQAQDFAARLSERAQRLFDSFNLPGYIAIESVEEDGSETTDVIFDQEAN